MDIEKQAREIFARYERPTYRLELIHRPHPDLPEGTEATLAFTIAGKQEHERLKYMGNGRWLPTELADWLHGEG